MGIFSAKPQRRKVEEATGVLRQVNDSQAQDGIHWGIKPDSQRFSLFLCGFA
jgi:hypothetical protein